MSVIGPPSVKNMLSTPRIENLRDVDCVGRSEADPGFLSEVRTRDGRVSHSRMTYVLS